MKNTINTTYYDLDYPLKISEYSLEDKIKMKQLLTFTNVIISAHTFNIRKDYRVHQSANEPLNWDEEWFGNYE